MAQQRIDYRYGYDVVKTPPPLITVRWTDKKTGQRWRATGVDCDCIHDAWVMARATGSVGDSQYMNHTAMGGCEFLLATVRRIDAAGNDVQPK